MLSLLADLARRWPTRIAIAIAVALGLPSLRSGLMLDDHAHLAALRGEWPAAWWDLFRFIPGDPSQTASWIAGGPLPWWTDPSLELAFLRPLSSALIRLDLALFGERYALFHAHSLAWTAAWIALAAAVLRASAPRSLALPALLLFAVAPSHWAPVYWLASRNAIVASVFVYASLLLHVRARRAAPGSAKTARLVGSAVLFAIALSAGEAALGGLGYFVAFELCAAPRAGRRSSLLGVALVTCAWLGLFLAGGYGTRATGFYSNPLREPLVFLLDAPVHLLTQLGTIVLLVPSHVGVFDPRVVAPQIVLGVLAIAVAAALTRLAWSEHEREERVAFVWLALGGMLSLVPSLASSPGPRAIAIGSLGFAVAVTFWVSGARLRLRRMRERGRRAAGARVALWSMLALHAFVPLLYWPAFAIFSQRALAKGRTAALTLPLRSGPGQELVLLTVSDPPSGLYLPFLRSEASLPPLSRYWLISLVPVAHRLRRIDASTFDLEPVGRRFLDTPFEKIFRRASGPHAGDTVKLFGADVRVTAEEDGAPTRIRVHLDVPIETSNVIAWTGGRYVRIDGLGVGEERLLER